MILSTKAKNILDNVLHAAGAVCGFVAANQAGIIAAFPAQDQPVVALVASGVGVLGGDVVSDLIGMVDSGTSPTLAGIAQDLKLLADFVADVAVVWMKFFQLTGEGVNVFVRKFGCRRRRKESQTFRLTGGFFI